MGEALGMMERDLGEIVEGPFSSHVELLPPAGTWITTSSRGGPLKGNVTDAYVVLNETGEQKIVNEPRVELRISSLSRVPAAGEKWGIRIRASAVDPSLVLHVLSGDKAPERDGSRGLIYLYPQAVSQA
jgi:hypothetical protein